jgi:hypothetical protein
MLFFMVSNFHKNSSEEFVLLLNTRDKFNRFSVGSWKTQKNNQNF